MPHDWGIVTQSSSHWEILFHSVNSVLSLLRNRKHWCMKYSLDRFNYPNEPLFIQSWPCQCKHEMRRIQILSKILRGFSLLCKFHWNSLTNLPNETFHLTCQRINPFYTGYENVPFPWIRKQLRFQKRYICYLLLFLEMRLKKITWSVISSHSIS